MASYRYPNIEFGIKQAPTATPEPQMAVRYTRTNFVGAGVDNTSVPPSQDDELMTQLLNVMPVYNGVLQKRGGYGRWFDTGNNIQIDHMIDYQSDLNLQRNVILSSKINVQARNDDGSVFNVNIFTPALSLKDGPRACVSRSYAYFSDGQAGDYKKWNGAANGGASKWGIDINQGTALSFGPNPPSAASDLGAGGTTALAGPSFAINLADQPLLGNSTWVTLNAGNSDAAALFGAVEAQLNGTQTTDFLFAHNFGFSLPSTALIKGIQFQVKFWSNSAASSHNVIDSQIKILKNLTNVGTNHGTNSALPIALIPAPASWTDADAPGATTYGTPTDLWGTTWTYTDINAPGFGVAVQLVNADGTANKALIQNVFATVYYTLNSAFSWSNPTNIEALDGNVASAAATISISSAILANGFGFALPPAGIRGIQVDVVASSAGGLVPTISLNLNKAGQPNGIALAAPVPASALQNITFGGPNILWGGIWTYTDVNDPLFGVQIVASSPGGTSTVNIDYVTITLFTNGDPIALGAKGAGNIDLVNGRVYYAVFSNSLTGNYSDLNPPSASTGSMTSQDQTLTNIPVSPDAQVDQVVLLATADGGNQEVLYLIASLPNGTTTYIDNTPELTLLNQPILLSTDANGNEFGVANNNPPPVGSLYPTKFLGRIYMVQGATLYWSKNIAETTTSSGFIAGRWEEDWPAANSVDVSSGAETPRGLLTDGINLYIGTEYKIMRQNGDAATLENADIVHNQVGITNQDVWKIVFIEGTPQGAVWLTPDNRVVGSDFNTYNDIGIPIQATLNTVNGLVAPQCARAAFYSNGPFDLYVLAIPTGTSISNDTLCVYNLRTHLWYIWQFADNVADLLFNITIDGSSQLLFSTPDAPLLSDTFVYDYDPSFALDQSLTAAPKPIQLTIQTNWLDLQDPASRKVLNEIEIQTADTAMLVTVEGASNESEYMTPRIVVDSVPITISPRGDYKVYLASAPSTDRYYRFTFVSSSALSPILGGFNVEHVMFNRQ